MIKNYSIVAALLLLIVVSCSNAKNEQQNVTNGSVNKTQNNSELKAGLSDINQDFSRFLPEGYILFDSVFGAVSKEGATYYVLFIKGTDKKNVVKTTMAKWWIVTAAG